MVVGCVACGPSVAVSDGETSTSTGNGMTTNADTTTTSVDVTTAPPDSSGIIDATTEGTTTPSVEESSSTGEYTCGCPEDAPIGLDDELPTGGTPAEILARFAAISLPLEWHAYDDVVTTVHLEAAYDGGMITVGPGGSSGCLFLDVPCLEGMRMEVSLTVTTDDGWLSFETTARISGTAEEALLEGALTAIESNAGTLVMQPLQIGANELRVDSVQVSAYHEASRDPAMYGEVSGVVSSRRCGDTCTIDDECGPRQACIDSICIGGPCGDYEQLGAF